MKLFSELQRVVKHLEPYQGSWAICGGIAACIYRDKARFTADIDIAICNSANQEAEEIAASILQAMGHTPALGFITDPNGSGQQTKALIHSRDSTSEFYLGIDFLLPVFPWVNAAVIRAQTNQIDYGFTKIPTITVEDLIIAKLFALNTTPERLQDKDDVLSILVRQKIDELYVERQATLYNLDIPRWLREKLSPP
jgi:Nucleotidyl transferase AbiEii toxin, Type IV TA system